MLQDKHLSIDQVYQIIGQLYVEMHFQTDGIIKLQAEMQKVLEENGQLKSANFALEQELINGREGQS